MYIQEIIPEKYIYETIPYYYAQKILKNGKWKWPETVVYEVNGEIKSPLLEFIKERDYELWEKINGH